MVRTSTHAIHNQGMKTARLVEAAWLPCVASIRFGFFSVSLE